MDYGDKEIWSYSRYDKIEGVCMCMLFLEKCKEDFSLIKIGRLWEVVLINYMGELKYGFC